MRLGNPRNGWMERRDFIKSAAIGGSVLCTDLLATARKAVSDPSAQSQAKKKYPHLFSPIQIANHNYRNRILCAPMVFGFMALVKDRTETMYRLAEERAKGGTATVTIGETPVNNSDAPDVLYPGTEVDYTKREGKGKQVGPVRWTGPTYKPKFSRRLPGAAANSLFFSNKLMVSAIPNRDNQLFG